MKRACLYASIGVLAAGTLLLCMNDLVSGLLMVPLLLGPVWVSLFLGFLCKKDKPQLLLLVSVLLYAILFAYIHIGLFYLHNDPQNSIALFNIG
ncbi:hypothetical protein JXA32_06585 [Candidatus Sumerlaeota bacterium]|nr:hypothetical protein [Candidatus Sumerlaeota bacterium]